MLDLDPRDFDSRDDERHSQTPSRGGRGSSGDHDRDHSQTFYAGLWRERELEHDLQVYRAYEQAVSSTALLTSSASFSTTS